MNPAPERRDPGARAEARFWRAPAGKVTGAALWLLGLYFLAAFLFLAWHHIPWPFELEWMEGGMLDHVHRLLEGGRLYGPPALEFTAFSYPPLYFYFAAALGTFFSAGFPLLRTISTLALLFTVLLIGYWIRRESGSRRAGVLAGALYLASYPVSGFWFGLARVDSLFLLLLLAGLYLLRRSRTLAGGLGAALLLALAFFCKQTALVISLPVMIWLALCGKNPRRWIIPAAWLGLLAAGLWMLQRASGGWLFYYLFYLPGEHLPVWWRVHHFWIDYFFKPLPIATLAGGLYLLAGSSRFRGRDLFWPAAAAGLVGGPWLASVPSGAFHNVAMPAHAAFAMLFALAVQRWFTAAARRESPSSRQQQPEGPALRFLRALCARPALRRCALFLPWAAALLQLILLLYNPLHHLPAAADRQAGEALVRRIAAVQGELWIPSHGYLARLAGKSGCAHRCALDDVLRGTDEPGKRELEREIAGALVERSYAVIIASDDWLALEIERGYGEGRRIFDPGRRFYPLTGWQTRPELWYERREK